MFIKRVIVLSLVGLAFSTNAYAISAKEALKQALNEKTSINKRFDGGNTALHISARQGNRKILTQLLESGADISVKNENGKKAIDLARANNHIECAAIISNYTLFGKNYKALLPQVSAGTAATAATAAAAGGGTSILTVAGGIAAAGGAVALAGGGSGSNGTGGAPEEEGTNPTEPSNPNFEFTGTEYQNSTGLAQINAASAYAAGFTGEGIKIAVIDTGVDALHTDLNDNLVGGEVGIEDTHGTHVAGIIAAEKDGNGIHGVAYNAEIISQQVIGTTTENTIAGGIIDAVDSGAEILNNSWSATMGGMDIPVVGNEGGGRFVNGGTGANAQWLESNFGAEVEAFKYAAENDVISVFAAGNSSLSTSGVFAGLPLHFEELEGSFVSVIALDANNEVASFSNRCGQARNWCLAAPGVQIASTVTGGQYAEFSGTSMAAPYVSGSLALLLEAFPEISNKDALSILFETATDLGQIGVDYIYGHGLVNLDAAFNPVGATSFTTSSGTNVSTSGTVISIPSAFGGAGISAANATILDSYNREFNVSLNDYVKPTKTLYLSDISSRFAENELNEANLDNGLSLAFGEREIEVDADQESSEDGKYFRISYAGKNGSYSLSKDINMNNVLGFAEENAREMNIMEGVGLDNTYLNLFAENNMAVASSLNIGAAALSFAGIKSEQDGFDASGFVSGINGGFGKLKLAGSIGLIEEQGGLLGFSGTGAFDLEGESQTSFASLTGVYSFNSALSFYAKYELGLTKGSNIENGIVSNVSDIYSDSFAFGATYAVDRLSKLGASISQPMRARSGEVQFNFGDGNVSNADISASVREIDFSMFYDTHVNGLGRFSAAALYRVNPDHDETADDELILLGKYKAEF